MRHFGTTILLIALFAAGCTENNYYSSWPSGVIHADVLSPAANDTVNIIYRWGAVPPNGSNGCPSGYIADTSFTARIAIPFNGGVLSAKVYRRYSYYFEQVGSEIYPFSRIFDVTFNERNRDYRSSVTPQTYSSAFYVTGLTMDSAVWTTDTIEFTEVNRIVDILEPPQPPTIQSVIEESGYHNLDISWCDNSPGINRTVIYRQRVGSAGIQVDSAMHNDYNLRTLYRYEPLTTYAVWLRSRNERGLSAPSDTTRLTTAAASPPEALYGYYDGGPVTLRWQNPSWCDTLAVMRREISGEWIELSPIPNPYGEDYPSRYVDDSAVTNHVNYYRIGFRYLTGTWWSVDSVGVWVP